MRQKAGDRPQGQPCAQSDASPVETQSAGGERQGKRASSEDAGVYAVHKGREGGAVSIGAEPPGDGRIRMLQAHSAGFNAESNRIGRIGFTSQGRK